MNRFFRYHLDHVLFWILTTGFHAYTHQYLVEKAGVWQFLLEVLVRNGLLAVVIYVNLLVIIPGISTGRKTSAWLVVLLASLVLYVLIKNAHDAYLYGVILKDTERSGFFYFTFYNVSIVLFYATFATALHLSRQWYRQRETLRQIKLEKLNTELNYLKAQLNPHFLFNSLNTIFFQIHKDNTEARETLGRFSDMLRYQLYEGNADTLPIEKEVEYLKNYVALQQLRKDEHYTTRFQFDPLLQGFSIPPLLLIPFIENAFKHVSNYSDRPNEVDITLHKHGEILALQVTNTTDEAGTKQPGGIGLKNVKRRLELLFPGTHWLTLEQAAGRFSVTLKLLIV